MQIHTLNMSRTATTAALPATITAVDADGESFDLAFDFATTPAAPRVAVTLAEVIAALLAAGIEVSNRWGRAPLYAEQGTNKPVRIVRTPGTSGDVVAATTALRDAGFTATLRDQRISITAA